MLTRETTCGIAALVISCATVWALQGVDIQSTNTGIVDDGWLNFTSSPTCGTATFTVNSAKSKTIGSTTFVEVDVTFTALGTCTTQVNVNLPNTSSAPGAVPFIETATGAVGICTIGSGVGVMNCFKAGLAAFANGNEIRGSGVYTHQ